MGKVFAKLAQRQVWIATDDLGNGFNCDMLPVSALSEMHCFQEAIARIKNIKELESIRNKMIALIKTVLPEQYHENLLRLDFSSVVELITYLMYGDNDDLPKSEKNVAREGVASLPEENEMIEK